MGLAATKAALAATADEIVEPEPKDLAALLHYINKTNMSVEHLADILSEKTRSNSWVVVFKALVTVHHLIVHGKERFIQHLASRNSLFTLHNFLDQSVIEGDTMSNFIRQYGKYLNERSLAYRQITSDITKTKRGMDGMMRTMNTRDLLDTLPIIQTQFDALLNFNANPDELNNGIIHAAFRLLFRDSLLLFAVYNEGILNLLGKFFDMKKNQCETSLDIYIKFIGRTTKFMQFLEVAEQVGIDQNNIPYLTQAPPSLLEALQKHLASLEEEKHISPPRNFQLPLIPSTLHSSFVKISSSQDFKFEETPINRSGMKCHQSSEMETTDEMNWHLNASTCASSLGSPLTISPLLQMVPRSLACPVTSQQVPQYRVIPASVGAPFPMTLQSVVDTKPDLGTNNPFTLSTRNKNQLWSVCSCDELPPLSFPSLEVANAQEPESSFPEFQNGE